MSDYFTSNDRYTVLDTQAVLDWLYFGDPLAQTWEAQREAGAWVWLASQAMRDELAHVLGRGSLPPPRLRSADEVLAVVDRSAHWLAAPPALGHGPLRCTDPDDQKFIDFSVHHRCRWLVSRDRAVLKLKRKAATLHQVQFLSPADWSAQLAQRPLDGASQP